MNLRKDHYRIVKGERRSCVCARHFLPPPPFVRGDGFSPRGCLNVERHPVTNCCAQRTPTPRPWTVGQVANVGINGVTHIWVGFRPATAPWLEALGRPWPSVAGPPSTEGKAERERSVTSVEGEAARCPQGNRGRVPSRPFERARTRPDNCAAPPSTRGTANASAVGHGTWRCDGSAARGPEIPPSAANATALLGEPEAAGRFLQARRGIRRRFAVMCGRSRHGDVTVRLRSTRRGIARSAVPPSAALVCNR